LAHRLAVECDAILADMVEIIEFPQLTTKYKVMGVPKIVINDELEFEGALPEDLFVAELMRAAKS
jgi:protein-disulfide isomerase